MIVAMHMDDRLVHGQVVMSWMPTLQANVVMVANDEVFDNKMRRSTMKLAVPSGAKIAFRKIDGAVEFFKDEKNAAYRVLLLVNNPQDAETLCAKLPEIKKISIGGIRKKAPMIHDNLNLTPEDIECFKRIMDSGVSVGMQPTPTNKFISLDEIFKKYERDKQD